MENVTLNRDELNTMSLVILGLKQNEYVKKAILEGRVNAVLTTDRIAEELYLRNVNDRDLAEKISRITRLAKINWVDEGIGDDKTTKRLRPTNKGLGKTTGSIRA